MGNDIFRRHMQSTEESQHQHQYNDILRWHMRPFEATLNRKDSSIKSTHDHLIYIDPNGFNPEFQK